MVRGMRIAVTAVAPKNQWAETIRMARGRGKAAPSVRQPCVYRFVSRVFIGLPCPMNSAGLFITTLLPRGHRTASRSAHHREHARTLRAPLAARQSSRSREISMLSVDAPRGFEPRLTESESVVLPLDDGAMRECGREGAHLVLRAAQVKPALACALAPACSAR